ncbi:MAG: hypothetical protein DCC55_37825, partial [Chloroflexi bacterium]
MSKPTVRNGFLFFVMVLVLHLVLWLPLPLWVQTVAVLMLLGLAPGILLVELLLGHSQAPPDRWEWWLYSAGAGYALLVLGMLLLSYLPGGVAAWQVLVGFDGLLLVMGALWWWRKRRHPRVAAQQIPPAPRFGRQSWYIGVAVAVLVTIGGVLRFHNLGYAEFLTDEARVVLRAAAVAQGYEDALFIHRKGPVEILLPTAAFVLLGELNETGARLPFAVANLVAVLAVFYLGRQLWGAVAGWGAALLLALDGYLIGFARFVQYQSVVLLMSVLAVLILHRLMHRPVAVTRHLLLATLLVATGLLSHYDGLVTLIPVALALFFLFRRTERTTLLPALGMAGAIGGLILALFYLPFFLHPNFSATYAYLLDNRLLGGDLPYNNLTEITQREMTYDSLLLVTFSYAMMVLALALALGRAFGRIWGALLGLLFGTVLFLAIRQPALFEIGWVQWLLLSLALPIGLIGWAPRLTAVERMFWLWWGVPVVAAVYLVAQPGTHVYVVAVPGALLIGS